MAKKLENKQTFPMLEVLAVSCAIQRNKGKFLSSISDNSNAHDLKVHFGLESRYTGYVPVEVIEDDRIQANKAVEHFSKLAFLIISGKCNFYNTEVYQIISSKEVTLKQFGYIASMPYTYARELKDKDANKLITQTNDKLYAIDTVLTTACYIIRVSQSSNGVFYSHIAITTEGSLIHFNSQKCVLANANEIINIRGTVIGHISDYWTEKLMSQLIKVKVL
jgi:ribosomal protein L14